MTKKYYPDWKDIVTYSEGGPRPYVLVETDHYKSVIAGLAAGQRMPPHAEGPAVFHFLEGKGQMIVGEQVFGVQAGATLVVPDGAVRGVEAETRLAFLAVRLPKS